MLISWSKLVLVLLVIYTASTISIEGNHDIEREFCWKDSYGRGVGLIPSDCGSREKIGFFCYDRCQSGYSRFNLDCLQNCPSDLRDDGFSCRGAEYERAGYDIYNEGKCNKENKPLGCERCG